MCKYPRELHFKISTRDSPRRPPVNRISFLSCDNASSGVIAPRCVYIDGISMASKEFVIAGRSRYLIYRGLSGWTKTRSAPILICSPRATVDYATVDFGELSYSFESSLESRGTPLSQSACPTSPHHEYLPIFSNDAWYQSLIRLDTKKNGNTCTCNSFFVSFLK